MKLSKMFLVGVKATMHLVERVVSVAVETVEMDRVTLFACQSNTLASNIYILEYQVKTSKLVGYF
jgi:hypothetical protein